MKALAAVFLLLLATPAAAAQEKIVETETGITVEYTGTPPAAPEASAAAAASAATAAGRAATEAQARSLAAQIVQLRKEAAELSQLTGSETPEELALKKGLADEKRGQIEAYVAELNRLTAPAADQAKGADAAGAPEAKPPRAPNYRAEKKQQIRELKMLRMNQPAP